MDSPEKIEMSLESTDVQNENWTEPECLQLIEYFKLSPLLWDMNHPDYYNKSKKANAWKVIAKAMDRTPTACKHKMGVLNSSFRREKSKITQAVSNLQHYTSNWFAFSAMSFLLIKEKKLRKKNIKKPHSESYKARLKAAKAAEEARKKELLNSNSSHDAEISKDLNYKTLPSTSQSASIEDQEVKTFTNFVATKMKKYSDSTRSLVQQAICDILFKADRGYYNKTSRTVTSTVGSTPVVDKVITIKQEDSDLDDSE